MRACFSKKNLLQARSDILVTGIICQRNKRKHFSTLPEVCCDSLTYWSDVETLMPYLETPIINSSSPGTKGNFPSCFGGKQTKAFSADRRTRTMKIHSLKRIYLYFSPLDQQHHYPCVYLSVWSLTFLHLPHPFTLCEALHESRKEFVIWGGWGGWPCYPALTLGDPSSTLAALLCLAVKIVSDTWSVKLLSDKQTFCACKGTNHQLPNQDIQLQPLYQKMYKQTVRQGWPKRFSGSLIIGS